MANASAKVVLASAILKRFWLGMTITVSAHVAKLIDAFIGRLHPALSLEDEWLGNDGHCQYSRFAGGLRYNGSSTRSGSASHTCGHEAHVRSCQVIHDFVDRFFGCGTADVGQGPSAQAFRDVAPN